MKYKNLRTGMVVKTTGRVSGDYWQELEEPKAKAESTGTVAANSSTKSDSAKTAAAKTATNKTTTKTAKAKK